MLVTRMMAIMVMMMMNAMTIENYDMNLTLMMDVIMMISSINHPLQFSTVFYSVNLLVLPFH